MMTGDNTAPPQMRRVIADMAKARAGLNRALKTVARENPKALGSAGVKARDVLKAEDPLELFRLEDEDEDPDDEYSERVCQIHGRKAAAFKKLKQLAKTDPERVRKAGLNPERVLRMLAVSEPGNS